MESMSMNIDNYMSNFLDLNTDFEKLLKSYEDNNEYFLEIVTILTFIPQKKLNDLFSEVTEKISFYFDIDIEKYYNNLQILIKNNYYGEITIEEAKLIILETTNFDITHHISTRQKKTKYSIPYNQEQEMSKFYFLTLTFMCILYINIIKEDKNKWKALGLFNPKPSFFYKQTPEQYLEKVNSSLILRIGCANQCKEKGLSISESLHIVKSKYPFKTVIDILWWKKFWTTDKPIMGMNEDYNR